MSPQEFLYWLRNWLTYVYPWDTDKLTPQQIQAEIEKIIKQETSRVMPAYGPAGRVEDSPYYPQVFFHYQDFTQATAPETPERYLSPNVQVVTQGGRQYGYIYDTAGNLIDIRDYGVAEKEGLTAWQQSQIELDRQQFAQQQQQWAAEMAYQQQQSAYQAALAQAQMQQQAATTQAQLGLEAQLSTLPYGQMTAYQLAEAQQAYQQYQAEMRANPTRWIQSYYAQQQPEPWYMGLTPTAPAINIPQIPTTQYPQYPPMPPVDWEALLSGLLPLLQPPTPPTKAEVYKQATPTQKKAIVQKAAVETIGRPLSTVFPYGTSATYKGG